MTGRGDDPLRFRRDELPDELVAGRDPAPADRGPVALVATGVGALLHLAAGALLLATGLLAPAWAVGLFGAAWVAGGWVMVRWRDRWPLLVPLVPFAVLGAVWLAIRAGGAWLGWGA